MNFITMLQNYGNSITIDIEENRSVAMKSGIEDQY